MNKIWIILKSEFLRRVKSKWFIVATLLAPVVLIALTVLPSLIAVFAIENDERAIAVVDETGVLLPRLEQASEERYRFEAPTVPADSLRSAVKAGVYDGYLLLPAGLIAGDATAVYYSAEGGGLTVRSRLESLIERAVEEQRLVLREAPPEVLEILQARVPLQMVKLTEAGEEADSTLVYSIIGYLMGFVIYVGMFIYGAMVMHGVLEEKTSRVVEVMVSSVRPFELLMGKVLGIGAMGLFQMILWSLLVGGGLVAAGGVLSLFLDPASMNLPPGVTEEVAAQSANFALPTIPFEVFFWFVLFFLGGYLLYASLFAAVGSAVEQQQDAQALMLPITMPIVIPILFITYIVESPNALLSVVLSLVPFFSPILMVVRVAVTDVPFWQVALAFLLLIGTFIGAIWLSSRIYRVGILMYGKKASFKDLARWLRYA